MTFLREAGATTPAPFSLCSLPTAEFRGGDFCRFMRFSSPSGLLQRILAETLDHHGCMSAGSIAVRPEGAVGIALDHAGADDSLFTAGTA